MESATSAADFELLNSTLTFKLSEDYYISIKYVDNQIKIYRNICNIVRIYNIGECLTQETPETPETPNCISVYIEELNRVCYDVIKKVNNYNKKLPDNSTLLQYNNISDIYHIINRGTTDAILTALFAMFDKFGLYTEFISEMINNQYNINDQFNKTIDNFALVSNFIKIYLITIIKVIKDQNINFDIIDRLLSGKNTIITYNKNRITLPGINQYFIYTLCKFQENRYELATGYIDDVIDNIDKLNKLGKLDLNNYDKLLKLKDNLA